MTPGRLTPPPPFHRPPHYPCRHVDQHRGGDVEGQAEGCLPGPQRLLRLHGQLLHRHRVRNDGGRWFLTDMLTAARQRAARHALISPSVRTPLSSYTQRRDAGDDAPGPHHFPEVRLGRGGAHHARHPPRHGRRLLLPHHLQRSVPVPVLSLSLPPCLALVARLASPLLPQIHPPTMPPLPSPSPTPLHATPRQASSPP